MTLKADPFALTQGGTVIDAAGQQALDGATTLRDGCRTASGACGSGKVAAALDRFTAAWGGELIAWGLSVQELGRVATENGRQVAQANGFTSPFLLNPGTNPFAPTSPAPVFPYGVGMPTLPQEPGE